MASTAMIKQPVLRCIAYCVTKNHTEIVEKHYLNHDVTHMSKILYLNDMNCHFLFDCLTLYSICVLRQNNNKCDVIISCAHQVRTFD